MRHRGDADNGVGRWWLGWDAYNPPQHLLGADPRGKGADCKKEINTNVFHGSLPGFMGLSMNPR